MGSSEHAALQRYLAGRYAPHVTVAHEHENDAPDAASAASSQREVITLTPTDPELPVPVSRMCVSVAINSAIIPEMRILSAPPLPPVLVRGLDALLQAQVESHVAAGVPALETVKRSLRWLDNHLSDHLTTLIDLQTEAVHRSAAPTHDQLFHPPWSRSEHASFERALHAVFQVARCSVLDPSAWHHIAAATGRAPAACLAHYMRCDAIVAAGRAIVAPVAQPPPVATSTAAYASVYSSRGEGATGAPVAWRMEGEVPELTASASASGGDATGDAVEVDASGDEVEVEVNESESEAEAEEDFIPTALPTLGRVDSNPAHRGVQVILDRLDIFGIGTLASSRLSLLCQCVRCAHATDVTLPGATLATSTSTEAGDDLKAWCVKCSLLHSAQFRSTLVHEGNPALGYVDATGTRVAGFKSTALIVSCLECETVATVARFAPPAVWEAACHNCHSRMRLVARGVRVEDASPSTAAAAATTGPTSTSRVTRLQAGKPLPASGACRHYAHSYRWLRFPCCDTPFPCDVCHDAESDHSHEWARRMICGHCAREQPFSNAPCVACGKYTTRGCGPTPRFWQGGTGQRNQARMSRKDAHKYADSGLKTHSRKQQRVGAAGAATRAKAAAARGSAEK